jgi:hypothetical protein
MPLPFDPMPAAAGYVSFAIPPLSLFPTFAIPVLTLVHFVTIVAVRHQSIDRATVQFDAIINRTRNAGSREAVKPVA